MEGDVLGRGPRRVRVSLVVGIGLGLVSASLPAQAWASTIRAASDTATFTSSQIGTSGSTSQFSESQNWEMAWSFDCSSYGSPGNFMVDVNQPTGDTTTDPGPNELGMSGSGTDYYTDTGTFSLSINSECSWTITVSPNGSPPGGGTESFSSNTTGSTGETSQFSESGPWTMSWSYDCSSYGSQGNFMVDVNQPPGDTATDTGPNELGMNGSGQDTYYHTVIFSLDVDSECSWSVQVAPVPQPPHCSTTLPAGTVVGMATTSDGKGYWIASSTGAVAACGDATNYGNGPSDVAAIASSPAGNRYWLVTPSGAVFSYGGAPYHGGIPSTVKLDKPIVAMAADPASGGYWLLGGDGGVFSFDAPFYGSTGNIKLVAPAVGMEATLDGGGYRFVASDGGVFDFGNARFYGSMGGVRLNKPVVGMANDPATGGYWLDASDGGIFSFNAPFYGSTGNIQLAQPCVAMTAMPDGGGYRLVAADGGIFDFGDAPFEGSAA